MQYNLDQKIINETVLYFTLISSIPAGNYVFKVNIKDTRAMPLTLNIIHTLFSVSIVNFQQENTCWDSYTVTVQT